MVALGAYRAQIGDAEVRRVEEEEQQDVELELVQSESVGEPQEPRTR
ncbi:MAG TPA: hypothetical protein PJ992_05215 [Arachnia sp.]|nr:hypothetical protein [Arachnia sp.]HMR12465.1 hypothetical protein [Arachnia sp.]